MELDDQFILVINLCAQQCVLSPPSPLSPPKKRVNSRPFGGGLVRSCLCLCVFAFYDKATTLLLTVVIIDSNKTLPPGQDYLKLV